MPPELLIGLLTLATAGVLWLAWKRVRGHFLTIALIVVILVAVDSSLLFFSRLLCLDDCTPSALATNLRHGAIFIWLVDILVLLLAALSCRPLKNRPVNSPYGDASASAAPLSDFAPQVPDPLNPNEVWAPIVKGFYRLKERAWFAPTRVIVLATAAVAIGYFSFFTIYDWEVVALQAFNLDYLTTHGFLLTATVEQLALGALAFIFFLTSKKWYLPFFLYAGFMFSYGKTLAERGTIADSFTPLLVYALAGVLLALGFKFFKKWGVLVLLVTILGLADYNNKAWTGHHLNFRDIFYPAESASFAAPTNDLSGCGTRDIADTPQARVVLYKCNPSSNIYFSFITVNEKEQKRYYDIDGGTITTNGTDTAYTAHERNRERVNSYVVWNEKEYPLSYPNTVEVIDGETHFLPGLSVSRIALSKDGVHLAYVVNHATSIDVYRDGAVLVSYNYTPADFDKTNCSFYDAVSNIAFTKDNVLTYTLSQPGGSECAETLVIDGAEKKLLYEHMGPYAVSSDGLRVAYAGYEEGTPVEGTEFSEGNFYLILNDKKIKTFSFPEEKIYDLAFSYDDRVLCYTLGSPQDLAREAYAVIGDREYRLPYDAQASEQDFSNFCSSQSNTLR